MLGSELRLRSKRPLLCADGGTGEIASLMCSDIDRTAGTIRLRAEHSKDGQPRKLAAVGELHAIIERRCEGRTYTTVDKAGQEQTAIALYVLHRESRQTGTATKMKRRPKPPL